MEEFLEVWDGNVVDGRGRRRRVMSVCVCVCVSVVISVGGVVCWGWERESPLCEALMRSGGRRG